MQQKLPARTPSPSKKSVAFQFSLCSIVSLLIAIVVLQMSSAVVEISSEYTMAQTSVNLSITEDMPKPVYLYYTLKGYYQNHREYVASLNYNQMRGLPSSALSVDCKRLLMEGGKQRNPCGLIMGKMFTDSFAISGHALDVSDIAWPSAKLKYKNAPNYAEEVGKGPNSTDFLLYQVTIFLLSV
jgi:hypothetical protein